MLAPGFLDAIENRIGRETVARLEAVKREKRRVNQYAQDIFTKEGPDSEAYLDTFETSYLLYTRIQELRERVGKLCDRWFEVQDRFGPVHCPRSWAPHRASWAALMKQLSEDGALL